MPEVVPDPIDFPAYVAAQRNARKPQPVPIAGTYALDGKGRPLGSLGNVILALREDAEVVMHRNEFSGRNELVRAPWAAPGGPREWIDADDTALRSHLEREIGLRPPKAADVSAAVDLIARERPYNPVTSYLDALRWDRHRRLARWVEKYLGAGEAIAPDEDAAKVIRYVRLAGSKFLIAAVARAYRPGCKVDNMLVAEGPQGREKSRAVEVLFSPWYASLPIHPASKDSAIALRGVWGCEWSELDGLGRADLTAVKRYISTGVDRIREPYARRASDVPRGCVFVGTVNEAEYMRDATGGRRFWPVRVGGIDLAGLRRDRDQLWAEAVRWYRRGVVWWVLAHQRELFEESQERRYTADAFEERLAEYLAERPDIAEFRMPDVLHDALGMRPERWTQQDQRRVGAALRRLGLQRRKAWRHGRAAWVWARSGKNG